MKKNRIFVVIDKGMIWEAYSDEPITFLIKNNDKFWVREQAVEVNSGHIDKEQELIEALKEEDIKLPGLAEEEVKHIKVKKLKHGKKTK